MAQRSIGAGLALAFFAGLTGAALSGRISLVVPVFYGMASALTFVAYARDKAAARRHQWRTRETSLHLLGVCGGWPGALLAQSLLRHKSSKPAFQSVSYVTALLNCGVLIALFGAQTGPLLHLPA